MLDILIPLIAGPVLRAGTRVRSSILSALPFNLWQSYRRSLMSHYIIFASLYARMK